MIDNTSVETAQVVDNKTTQLFLKVEIDKNGTGCVFFLLANHAIDFSIQCLCHVRTMLRFMTSWGLFLSRACV